MKPIQLHGPVGAVIILLLVAIVLTTGVLASYLIRTNRKRRKPQWALELVFAGLVINGVGNWWDSLAWLKIVVVCPLELLAVILVLVELKQCRHIS